jgi:hypothetical protein
LSLLGRGAKKLYFVVHTQNHSTFEKQKADIDQYVVEIPYSSTASLVAAVVSD